MAEDRITIRKMSKEELDLAVEWAAREGWNPGLPALCQPQVSP